MGKRILSIELGLYSTKICEMEYNGRQALNLSRRKKKEHEAKVYKTLIFDTPENAIEDGYIRDKEGFAIAMRAAIQQAGLKSMDVIFSLSSSRIANREIEIPMVKEDKITTIIKANASDYFPVDISEYIISYTIIDQIETEEEKKLKLLLLAAPLNLVNNIYSFAEQMQFEVVSIDYAGNSVYQMLKRQISDPISISLQINEQNSLINIIEKDKLVLQRVVNFGSMAIVEAAMEQQDILPIENEMEAIEYLKKNTMINMGFDQPMPLQSEEMTDEQYEKLLKDYQIRDAITDSLRYLVNNVSRVIDYYSSKNPGKKIDSFYMSGSGAWFKGISHLFRKELGYGNIKKIENLFNVTFSEVKMMEALQSEFITCVGASFAPVGFVTRERELEAGKKENLKGIWIVLFVSVAASVIMLAASSLMKYVAVQEQNDLNNQIARIQNVDAVFTGHDAVMAQYGQVQTLYGFTENRNEELNNVLSELEKILPSEMTVNSFNATETGFDMNIESKTKVSVARLIMMLEQTDGIGTATVSGVTESENEVGISTVSFAVSCVYAEKAPVEENTAGTEETAVGEANTAEGQAGE